MRGDIRADMGRICAPAARALAAFVHSAEWPHSISGCTAPPPSMGHARLLVFYSLFPLFCLFSGLCDFVPQAINPRSASVVIRGGE